MKDWDILLECFGWSFMIAYLIIAGVDLIMEVIR